MLMLSNIILRHGNRTPMSSYESSFCKESVYPDGYGTLTKRGRTSSYQLGLDFKKRYNGKDGRNLLNGDPNPYKVYARSSLLHRCLMSLNLFLAALLSPDKTSRLWNPKLNWQPSMAETYPLDKDRVIRSESSGCDKLNHEYKKRKVSTDVARLFKNNERLINEMEINLGRNITSFNLWETYEILEIEYLMSLERGLCTIIPSWLDRIFIEKVSKLTVSYLGIIYDGKDRNYAKLLGGPLMNEIFKNIQNVLAAKVPETIFLYSGHDSTLYHFLSAMNIVNEKYFAFSTAMALEIYKNNESEFSVELYYHDNIGKSEPKLIPIPLCPYPCYLEEFFKNYKDIISTDRNKECRMIKSYFVSYEFLGVIILGIFIVLTISLCVNIIFLMKGKKVCI